MASSNDPIVVIQVSDAAQHVKLVADQIGAICASNNVQRIVHFKGFASGLEFSTLAIDTVNAVLVHLESFDAILWDGDDYNESSFTYVFRLLANRLEHAKRYPVLICIKLREQIEAFRESYRSASLPVKIHCIEITSDIFDKTEELSRFKRIPSDLVAADSRLRDLPFTVDIYFAMGVYFVHVTRLLMHDGVISSRNVACLGGYDCVYFEYVVDSHYEPKLMWDYFHCSRIKNNCVQEGSIANFTRENLTIHKPSDI